jgi:hypothetical protein
MFDPVCVSLHLHIRALFFPKVPVDRGKGAMILIFLEIIYMLNLCKQLLTFLRENNSLQPGTRLFQLEET